MTTECSHTKQDNNEIGLSSGKLSKKLNKIKRRKGGFSTYCRMKFQTLFYILTKYFTIISYEWTQRKITSGLEAMLRPLWD